METNSTLENNKKGKKNPALFIILVTIAILIICSTIWSIYATNANVNQAVDKISSFYMEELVDKRAIVLRDILNQDFNELNRIISLLESKDIQDKKTLRNFLSDTQLLCGAKKLALVDEDGTVYSAHSTISDASRYSFLRENFNDSKIITSNLYGAKKQVVLAVPVDNVYLDGKKITACFKQVDIDSVTGSLAYDENDDEKVSVGLFYKNGDNLTTSKFSNLGFVDNILDYIYHTNSCDSDSYHETVRNFRDGKSGFVTITEDEETKYIYYVPVEGTGWMLTVMVRDNIIADQLKSTSSIMIRRNVIQLITTAILIVIVFLIIGFLNKKNSDMRNKQHELEMKAENEGKLQAAYNTVEASRKELERQLDVIGGMANAFFAVDAINLKTGEFFPVKDNDTVNKLFENSIAYDEAIAQFIPFGVHPEDQEKIKRFTDRKTLVNRLKDTNTIVTEYHSIQPGVEWCRISFIVASRDKEGNAERVIFVSENITNTVKERKKYEQDLKIARDEAERANKAKTDFLFNMSHDIRTPMNAIIGFSNIIKKELDKPELVKTHLDKLQESSKYLLSIINNILDMARIESGKVELNIDVMDLYENDVANMFDAELQRKNIKYSSEVNIEHRYVYGDAQKLREITVNLFSNAVKYTPVGGSITYQLKELPCEKDGYATYEMTVKDTGIGMSKEFQKHIFESFSRERTSIGNSVVGTGLGMAIVKKLVDMQDGTITVDSKINKGSTFKVVLTYRIADSQVELIKKQTSTVTDNVDFKGKRILLAEDNDINAEIAVTILEDTGVIVDHAKDGIECVDMLSKSKPGYYDLILMDIQMPNMDGYMATQSIRRLEDKTKANIPIIAMTANAFEEDKKNALNAGMNGHLAKPIDIPKLMETLKGILK